MEGAIATCLSSLNSVMLFAGFWCFVLAFSGVFLVFFGYFHVIFGVFEEKKHYGFRTESRTFRERDKRANHGSDCKITTDININTKTKPARRVSTKKRSFAVKICKVTENTAKNMLTGFHYI